MRNRDVNTHSFGLGREPGINQDCSLEIENSAPVLHGAKELALAWAGHQVELRKGIFDTEIIFIKRQNVRRGVQCERGLGACTPLEHYANRDPVHTSGDAFEISQAEKQQIRGHYWGGLKGNARLTARQTFSP